MLQKNRLPVKDKGIVLIVGCGHQTIERIIERTRTLFDEPIHGVIGGLHYPVNGGRIMLGPINVQRIVGSDTQPWHGVRVYNCFSDLMIIGTIMKQGICHVFTSL